MKNNKTHTKIKRTVAVLPAILLLAAAVFGSGSLLPRSVDRALAPAATAACTTATLPTTYGVVTQTVNVATAGTYRVWSRIKAPDTTNNSYYFKVDSGCAYNVGDSSGIPANTWTWVNYQDGNTGAPIDVTLTAGSHTLTYTGKEANVQLDKVMLLGDTSCVPTTFGDNCAVTDTTSPTTSITSPSAGATVSGTLTINANASDASGVSRVDFLVDGAVKGSDTTASYSYSWNTTTVTNGSHTLQIKAYDTLGNVGTSTSVNVTVSNGSTSPQPTPPPATPTCTLLGDVNCDNRVNALDLSILVTKDGQNYPPADFNKDGTVGAADLAILIGKWTW